MPAQKIRNVAATTTQKKTKHEKLTQITIKSGDTLFKSAVADATTISEEFAPEIVNGVLAGFDDNDIQNKKNELKSKSEDEIYSILEETLNLSKE